jgi:hypothetical protein
VARAFISTIASLQKLNARTRHRLPPKRREPHRQPDGLQRGDEVGDPLAGADLGVGEEFIDVAVGDLGGPDGPQQRAAATFGPPVRTEQPGQPGAVGVPVGADQLGPPGGPAAGRR